MQGHICAGQRTTRGTLAFHCEGSRNQNRFSGLVSVPLPAEPFHCSRPLAPLYWKQIFFLVVYKNLIYTLEYVNLFVCISDMLSKLVA